MEKGDKYLFIIILLLGVFISIVSAQINSSNYNITSFVISDGGTNTSSANYKTDFTLGSITGNVTSALYKAFFGFWYTVGEVANTAPTTPTPSLVSVDGTNKTNTDLNCSALISDADGNDMNVTVRWYKNYALNLTIDYNNSYSNASTFGALLGSGNTSKSDNWSCSLRLHDGTDYSSWANSSNLTILNTLPTVTLNLPADFNVTTNRTPEFSWNAGYDADGDSLTYDLNLTCYPSCSDDNRLVEGIDGLSNVIDGYLKYLKDNNDYYNWTVRAKDDEGSGAWTTSRKIEVNSEITISLPNDTISFGLLAMDATNDTTDDSPLPFLLQNDGNCMLNVTINATNLWNSILNPTDYFKYKIDNKSGEEGSFDSEQSQTSWQQMPNATPQTAIVSFNWTDNVDIAEIDLNVTVPPEEGHGDKESTVYFTASLGE